MLDRIWYVFVGWLLLPGYNIPNQVYHIMVKINGVGLKELYLQSIEIIHGLSISYIIGSGLHMYYIIYFHKYHIIMLKKRVKQLYHF